MEFSPNFSPLSSFNAENSHQLYVSLPNKGFRIISVKQGECTDVKSLIESLVANPKSQQFYALRLKKLATKEVIWLSPGK